MSSGCPREENARRWQPARHPSAVGTAHDSRGAERGYSGPYDLEGQYGPDGQYAPDGQYPDAPYGDGPYGDGEAGWYNVPESGYAHPDNQPQPDNAGYGQVSYPDVYDLGSNGNPGFPGPSGHPGVEYVEHPSFPNLPAQGYGAPAADGYEQGGYPTGYAEPGYDPAGYQQGHPGHPGQPAQPG